MERVLQSGAGDLSVKTYLLLRNVALIREIALVIPEVYKFETLPPRAPRMIDYRVDHSLFLDSKKTEKYITKIHYWDGKENICERWFICCTLRRWDLAVQRPDEIMQYYWWIIINCNPICDMHFRNAIPPHCVLILRTEETAVPPLRSLNGPLLIIAFSRNRFYSKEML